MTVLLFALAGGLLIGMVVLLARAWIERLEREDEEREE